MSTQRTPSETRAPRMEALARLPVFYALTDKRTVIAGGSAAAAWKAELLAAAGAKVDVFAEGVSEELAELALNTPRIILHPRAIQPSDFAGAAMAIGAFEDDTQAASFAQHARRAGVPVNVIDKPAFCDFAFGSIVNRSPLVIGISTDGAAPVFGQAIRAKLEALIPRGFARWAEAARRWRPRVQALALSFRERRRFWEQFTERAVAAPDRVPSQADVDALMSETRGAADNTGSVVLVGAGPGDPEFLTLRAVRALQSADVILIDDRILPAGGIELCQRLKANIRTHFVPTIVALRQEQAWTGGELSQLDLIAGNLNGPAGTTLVAHQLHLPRFCVSKCVAGQAHRPPRVSCSISSCRTATETTSSRGFRAPRRETAVLGHVNRHSKPLVR